MEGYGRVVKDYEVPMSWYERDCEEERNCPMCLEKEVLLDKVAVHFTEVLEQLCCNKGIDKEILFHNLEEIAGFLEVDFNYKKLKIDRYNDK